MGSVDGKEVVQLYVNAPKGAMEKPSRELKAFAKTRLLKAGETEVVEMSIPLADLASFNEKRMASPSRSPSSSPHPRRYKLTGTGEIPKAQRPMVL